MEIARTRRAGERSGCGEPFSTIWEAKMGEENDGDAPREQLTEPKDAEQLRAWVEKELKLKLPREAVCQHHQSPFEYLDCAYFQKARDIVVWAPRGGGKTRL